MAKQLPRESAKPQAAHLKHARLKGAATILHKAGYISADTHADIHKHTNLHLKKAKRS